MYLKILTIFTILKVQFSIGAVLLWSNKKIEIPSLSDFTDLHLNNLVEKMDYPELTIYKTSSSFLPEFEGILEGFHTAYNPNGDINTENATEITDKEDLALLQSKPRDDDNILSVLMVTQNQRYKREATSTTEIPPIPSGGPVLYSAKSSKDIYSLLYSSQPLLLRNFSPNSTIEIGGASRVTVDTKNQITKLYVKVREENSIQSTILQFFFEKYNGYWSLNSVRVGSTVNTSYATNLTITESFSAPIRFSYHCNGETVFTDGNNVELVIYDFQAQMESKDGKFSDSYDCVDFTTAPIWSGLFVTALLGIGLVIALIAISEIKTMDKFDNQKTKQMSITVSE